MKKGIGCGNCYSCKTFLKLKHPDLNLTMPSESNNIKTIEEETVEAIENNQWRISNNSNALIRINQIRKLQEYLSLTNYSAFYRFIIVPDAEKMKVEASNAFLKMLEEPPKATVIILITHDINSLLPTILSRGQKVKFNKLNVEDISEILVNKFSMINEEAEKFALLGDGNIRQSLEYYYNKDLFEFRENIFLSLKKDNYSILKDLFPIKFTQRNKIYYFIKIIQELFRDCLFYKIGVRDNLINKDYIDIIKVMSKKYKLNYFIKNIKNIEEAYSALILYVDASLIRDYIFGGIN